MQTGRRKTKAPWLWSAAACLCLATGCGQEKKAAAPADTSSGNPLTAPADYVGAIGQAQKSAQKTLGSVGLDQAIKAFSAEHGRFPKSLDELVSGGTIGEVPRPPAGMKYDYNPSTGVVKVVPQ